MVDIIAAAYRVTDEEPRELDEQGRARTGCKLLSSIGLHHAKKAGDELWSPQMICDLCEKLRSDDIELDLEIVEYNARALPGGILLSVVNEGGGPWSVISLQPA